MLSKDIMSNWRGEGTVVVKPGQASENECRTELLRRVGDRGPRKSFQRPPSVHANRGSIGRVLGVRRMDVRGGRMGLPREGGCKDICVRSSAFAQEILH